MNLSGFLALVEYVRGRFVPESVEFKRHTRGRSNLTLAAFPAGVLPE
jgi:hypothetical protein